MRLSRALSGRGFDGADVDGKSIWVGGFSFGIDTTAGMWR